MTQAIGYVRRSTDKQDLSLEQQRAKLEQFAAVKGWTLATIYADDAISGSEMDRPGLSALVARAEQDKSIGAVLAWDRNRLARPKDPIDGLVLERRLMASGKRVCYVATGLEADRSFASGLMGYVEPVNSSSGVWPGWTSNWPGCGNMSWRSILTRPRPWGCMSKPTTSTLSGRASSATSS